MFNLTSLAYIYTNLNFILALREKSLAIIGDSLDSSIKKKL